MPRPCSSLHSRAFRKSSRRNPDRIRAPIPRSSRASSRARERSFERPEATTGSAWLLTFPQKVFDGLENVFFAFDARGDQLVFLCNGAFEFADELTASISAVDLAVAEQVHARE